MAVLAEADRRAAEQLAAYLTAVAPLGRLGRTGADARLLSAAGALVDASFWRGAAQIWLGETPLLPGDTAGTGAGVAPLLDPDGAPRGAVAVWGSVPGAAEAAMVRVSGALAFAAMLAAWLVGSAARRKRSRRLLIAVTVGVVALGILGQAAAVIRAERAATDAGLLRTRRMLEVSALGRRLTAEAAGRLTPGLVVEPLGVPHGLRDSAVTRDSSGAWVVAIAARDQAWRVVDRQAEDGSPYGGLGIVGFGLLALLLTLAAAALPPSEGYFTDSRPDPRAPA